MFTQIAERFRLSREPEVTVLCDDLGFSINERRGRGIFFAPTKTDSRIEWQNVSEVTAFKIDCFAVDDIRVVVATTDLALTVSERDIGYTEFVSALPLHLPGFPAHDEWFGQVAFPAFHRCWTPLYPSFLKVEGNSTPTPAES